MSFKSSSKPWIQLIGVALFIGILWRLDLRRVVEQVSGIQVQWLVVYFIAFVLTAGLKSLRWRTALIAQQFSISRGEAFKITVLAGMWGVMTPGKVGELSKVAYLDFLEVSVARRLVSVILDRLYDVAFLLIFGLAGSVYFLSLFTGEMIRNISVGILLFLAVAILLKYRHAAFRLFDWMLSLVLSQSTYQSIKSEWGTFSQEVSRVFRPTMPLMSLYSLAVYGCYFVQIYAVAMGYGVNLPFLYLSLCLSLSALLSMIPITVGGVGTREAVFMLLLAKAGISKETSVLIAFTDGVVLALSLSVVLALLVSLVFHVRLRKVALPSEEGTK